MNLLQIPIIDKFFVSPTQGRETGFAAEKGFLSPRPGTLRGSAIEPTENGIQMDGVLDGVAPVGGLKSPVLAH